MKKFFIALVLILISFVGTSIAQGTDCTCAETQKIKEWNATPGRPGAHFYLLRPDLKGGMCDPSCTDCKLYRAKGRKKTKLKRTVNANGQVQYSTTTVTVHVTARGDCSK